MAFEAHTDAQIEVFVESFHALNFRPGWALSCRTHDSRRRGAVMFKSAAANSITAVTGAAVVASLAIFFTSGMPEAKAEPQVDPGPQHQFAKGNRLPVLAKGAACSSHGWPYFEQSCQFDLRRPADQVRTVRVIALR
jgi:hypothetical protein